MAIDFYLLHSIFGASSQNFFEKGMATTAQFAYTALQIFKVVLTNTNILYQITEKK